nr:hypothetical protein [Rhodococcus sp. BS-15]
MSDATNAESNDPTSENAAPGRSAKKSLAVNLGVYTFARLALVVVIAAVIVASVYSSVSRSRYSWPRFSRC